MTHLRKGEIEDFLAGTLSDGELLRVIRHLLAGCHLCNRRVEARASLLLRSMDDETLDAASDREYDEAISRALAKARRYEDGWQEETEVRDRLLELLAATPGGLAGLSAAQIRAAEGWPLCDALLKKSFEERYRDPKRMLLLAGQAVRVAEEAPAARYPSGFTADLRARSWAELGNALRVHDRFAEAESAFVRAGSWLEEGTGDVLLLARVLDLEASLRSAQRRLDEAVALLGRVHELYVEAGDSHLAGRALLSRGSNVLYLGEARQAVDLLRQGLDLLDPDREPRLHQLGLLNVADALAETGELAAAGRTLLRSGLREALAAEPLLLLKLRWIEGKVHAGLGRLGRAGRVFAEVRAEYRRLGQEYDAALVGLDLAAAWLRAGRTEEVRALAEEMGDTFHDLGLNREAARALDFVREACRANRATAPMIDRVRAFLASLPWRPDLVFEPAVFA